MDAALVLVSFGVAGREARALGLEKLAREMGEALPDIEIRQAYTSVFIRKKLLKEGIMIPSLAECLAGLRQEGVQKVFLQPTYFTPGEEYNHKVIEAAEEFRGSFELLKIGEPLFYQEEPGRDDFAAGLEAVFSAHHLEAGEELVLLGHGSPHQHNPVYEKLQERADRQELPIHIGVVEESDTPNFAMVLARLQAQEAKKVLLAPLLLSGGLHVHEDMAGEGEGSWLSRLKAAGFEVRTELRGLAEYPAFRKLYLDKALKLVGSE
jgi:sirohydrochlorin cobaltochelatase